MSQSVRQLEVVRSFTTLANVHTGKVFLLNSDGTPYLPATFTQAAAQTDVAALTSVVAAGATPTKAEYDALRVDVAANRTVINALLGKLRTAGLVAP